MSKEHFVSLLLFVALFAATFFYTDTLQKPLISFSHSIQSFYRDAYAFVTMNFEEHFNQQQTIIEQREQLAQYKEAYLLSLQFANELDALLDESNTTIKNHPDVVLVRTLSYVKFGDHYKIWLEFPDFNTSKIYGLVHKGYTAGIVVARNNRAMALLNSDRKSAYSVFVGNNMAPGIVHGNGVDRLIVEYIPTWKKINIGDEVITSGLDELFFEGLKVGVVESIEQSQGYQNAIIKPYFNLSDARYFHVIKDVR